MKEWENVEEAERSLPGRAKMQENCGRCWCGCDIVAVFFFFENFEIILYYFNELKLKQKMRYNVYC